MKKYLLLLILFSIGNYAQSGNVPPNSILKNFDFFPTPRTNCRPGTVYRIDENGVNYIVQDVAGIKSMLSNEGTLIGQMTFTKEQLLRILNLDFNLEFITAEVEIKYAEREYTEQTNVDYVLWENDKAEEIITDPQSQYFIIRETVSSKDIVYRFDKDTYNMLVTGKSNLREKQASAGETIDFPYSIAKKFKEPKRLFYLKQEIKFPD